MRVSLGLSGQRSPWVGGDTLMCQCVIYPASSRREVPVVSGASLRANPASRSACSQCTKRTSRHVVDRVQPHLGSRIRFEALDPHLPLALAHAHAGTTRRAAWNGSASFEWTIVDCDIAESATSNTTEYCHRQNHEAFGLGHNEQGVGVYSTLPLSLKGSVMARWRLALAGGTGAVGAEGAMNATNNVVFRSRDQPEENTQRSVSLYINPCRRVKSDALAVRARTGVDYFGPNVSMGGITPRGGKILGWIDCSSNSPGYLLFEESYIRRSVYFRTAEREGWGKWPAEVIPRWFRFLDLEIRGRRDYVSDERAEQLGPLRFRDALYPSMRALHSERDFGLWLRLEAWSQEHTHLWKRSNDALGTHLPGDGKWRAA